MKKPVKKFDPAARRLAALKRMGINPTSLTVREQEYVLALSQLRDVRSINGYAPATLIQGMTA
jgi:hypothetical protein